MSRLASPSAPLAFLQLLLLFYVTSAVRAELFVTNPSKGATCTGGQPCTIEWLDNGVTPTLPSIGPCTVGLYHGQQQLVQTVTPVDVANVHSLTFTPDPNAGPNADTYYVSFISASLKNASNLNMPYEAFSSTFTLAGMSGSFSSPVPSDIATSPLPSSLTASTASASTSSSIITIGSIAPAPSLSSLTPSVTPSSTSSGFSSIRSASATGTSPAPSTSATQQSSNAIRSTNSHGSAGWGWSRWTDSYVIGILAGVLSGLVVLWLM